GRQVAVLARWQDVVGEVLGARRRHQRDADEHCCRGTAPHASPHRRQRVYSSSVNASRDGECGFSAKQVQFLVLRMNRARVWHGASKELAAITLPIPLTSVDINHQACRVSELAREHVWTG